MMHGGMILGLISGIVMMVSFAYVVFVLANKESGNVKLLGQILAAIIILLALVMAFKGATRSCCPMMGGKDMMMGKGDKGCNMDMMKEKGSKSTTPTKMKSHMK